MNEERTGKCLRQVEHILGHLWHRCSIAVNQVMNEERTGKCLRQVEHFLGHLWHRCYIVVNQVMNEERTGKCLRQVEHILYHLWHRCFIPASLIVFVNYNYKIITSLLLQSANSVDTKSCVGEQLYRWCICNRNCSLYTVCFRSSSVGKETQL